MAKTKEELREYNRLKKADSRAKNGNEPQSYKHKKKAIKRYENKLVNEGIKPRTIRLSDNEYQAIIKYQSDNKFSSLQKTIVSLIPKNYLN